MKCIHAHSVGNCRSENIKFGPKTPIGRIFLSPYFTDVDPDTEDDWDREYRPQIKKIGKPPKKVTRSMGPADNVECLVDLGDYSPRGPNRKEGR